MKIGKLTPEEIQDKIYMLGSYVSTLGDEIYQLPNGGLTNKAGWDAFNKELEKEIKNNEYRK